MTGAARTLRQALTIARRDFTATVFTPIFLLFLFTPLMIGGLSALSGMGAARAAASGGERNRIVAIVPDAQARAIAEADTRLRGVFREADDAPPPLLTQRPAGDPLAQARAAFGARDFDAVAVLFGPPDHPHVLLGPSGDRAADYLGQLAAAVRAADALGPPPGAVRITLPLPPARPGHSHASSFSAVFGLFFLTLFLSGQVVGSMADERNNKVVEVLAAAVPLEAVFFGKLLGMFGVALTFVAFWAAALTGVGSLLPPGLAAGLGALHPATGAGFPFLFLLYFAAAYLLLGSVFLGVGAQASSARELQLLSLPVTFTQFGVFALAAAAVARPGSGVALAAELFPLSSPYAMAGRAAGAPGLWPHPAALAWQAMWVAIFIGLGARAFRRGVLQSGSPLPRWLRRRAGGVNVDHLAAPAARAVP